MAYVIYLRKSRADLEAEAHGEGETLARHEKHLLSLAKKLKLNITGIYREIVSGETIAARPIVQKLISEVERGLWDGVLVMEVERLARGDTSDQGVIQKAFMYSNTQIVTPKKTYDPNNEFDEEYFEFGLFMSRREYKTINRRIQQGRIASINEGKYVSSVPPYGYLRVKVENGKGYTLIPHPEQSEAVKTIFNLYISSKIGADKISQELNRLGYKPARSEKWSRLSIRSILENPTYYGVVKWRERAEVKTIVNGVITKTRPHNPNPILVPGLHEALISKEIFDKAQAIRKANTIPKANNKNSGLKNPLAGIVICGVCGKKMQRQAQKGKVWLHCEGQYCKNTASYFEYVEDALLLALKQWFENYKLTITDPNPISPIATTKSAIARLEKEIYTIQSQIDKLHDLLEQGVYDIDTFLERNSILAQKQKEAKTHLDQMSLELVADGADFKKAEFIPKVQHVLDVYELLTDCQEKNTLLRTVIDKVIYNKERSGRNYTKAFILEIFPLLDV